MMKMPLRTCTALVLLSDYWLITSNTCKTAAHDDELLRMMIYAIDGNDPSHGRHT